MTIVSFSSPVKKISQWIIVLAALSPDALHAQQGPAKAPDTSPHKVQFIFVDKDVKLEVLDWGGNGSPLVFLAGSGFDAHVFDKFAPQFTSSHHVYGITRRGFGASSAPVPANGNYTADHLGDDVLAVIDDLKLSRPVLVGHSLAGEELSSIGSRHPEKVSGLIYLDAGYSYAFYSASLGDPIIDADDLKKRLDLFLSGGIVDSKGLSEMQSNAAQFNQDLLALQKQMALMPPRPPRPANAPPPPPIAIALSAGRQKYTDIHVPVLAIFADPHDFGQLYKDDPAAKAAVIANDVATTSAQADAFQAGIPSARVIRIPNADHFVFRSNEAEVVSEINAFLTKLPSSF
jgi:non-heme chloroperoxidase